MKEGSLSRRRFCQGHVVEYGYGTDGASATGCELAIADSTSPVPGGVSGLVREDTRVYLPTYGRAPETRDARENPAGQEAQCPLVNEGRAGRAHRL